MGNIENLEQVHLVVPDMKSLQEAHDCLRETFISKSIFNICLSVIMLNMTRL